MNGAGLTPGSVAGSGAGGGGRIMGAEAVHNKLAEVRGSAESTEGSLTRRPWVDGSEEGIWKTSLKRPLDGQYFCTTLLCNNIEVAPRRSIL